MRINSTTVKTLKPNQPIFIVSVSDSEVCFGVETFIGTESFPDSPALFFHTGTTSGYSTQPEGEESDREAYFTTLAEAIHYAETCPIDDYSFLVGVYVEHGGVNYDNFLSADILCESRIHYERILRKVDGIIRSMLD